MDRENNNGDPRRERGGREGGDTVVSFVTRRSDFEAKALFTLSFLFILFLAGTGNDSATRDDYVGQRRRSETRRSRTDGKL